MINIQDLVKAFINTHHGWAVADQFENTFHTPTIEVFEKQNWNALSYIREAVFTLLNDSDVLSDDAAEELQEYLDRLEAYLLPPTLNQKSN